MSITISDLGFSLREFQDFGSWLTREFSPPPCLGYSVSLNCRLPIVTNVKIRVCNDFFFASLANRSNRLFSNSFMVSSFKLSKGASIARSNTLYWCSSYPGNHSFLRAFAFFFRRWSIEGNLTTPVALLKNSRSSSGVGLPMISVSPLGCVTR